MPRIISVRSFSHFLNLDQIYHAIQRTQVDLNPHFFKNTLFQRVPKSNNLFCTITGKELESRPAKRDQGGIIHGFPMLVEAIRDNFTEIEENLELDENFLDEKGRFWGRVTRNRANDELLIKNPKGYSVNFAEFIDRDEKIARQALGEEAIELFSQYQYFLKSEKILKTQLR